MATLTGYLSAVAAAARKMAGAEGLAVAAGQGGGGEGIAPATLERAALVEGEAVDPVTPVRAVEAIASKHGPDMRRQEAPPAIRPLHRPGPAAVERETVVPRATGGQAEPEALRVQGASPRSDGEEPLRPVAQARKELLGSDVGRSAGPRSVEVVLHAADDLTAVIAESDEVREAILRTVADVMMER